MFRLTRYFSLVSAVVILCFTILLMFLSHRLILTNLKEAEERTGLVITEVLSNFLRDEYQSILALPDSTPAAAILALEETRHINGHVRELARSAPSIVKIKVFNLRGRAVYSSDPSQTGLQKTPDYPGVRVGRTGEITSTLEFRPRFSGILEELRDIQLLSSYIPLRSKNGNIEGVFEIYSDVTRVHSESLLQAQLVMGLTVVMMLVLYLGLLIIVRRGEGIIIKQSREIESQRAALIHASKLAALGEMAGGIAHEINNPLAILMGRAEQLATSSATRSEIPAGDLQRISQNMIETVQRISRVVRGLRTFARDGGSDPHTEVTVAQLVSDTLSFCEQKLKLQEIQLQLPADADNLSLQCRPSQISQALLNLVINAGDAIRGLPEKWIRIEARQAGDFVEIAVTDSGSGIAPETAKKIFDPFFTTKPVGEGTGLGLSIAMGIVKAHNGSIRLDSSSLNTRFVMSLPRGR